MDALSRRILLGMVISNADLKGSPFPEIGFFVGADKFFQSESLKDDLFRWGPPKAVWESVVRPADGARDRLVLFLPGRRFSLPPILCLLDSGYGVVAWDRLPSGRVHRVRQGLSAGDTYVEIMIEQSGPQEIAEPPVTRIRYKVAGRSLRCVKDGDDSMRKPGGGVASELTEMREWKLTEE